MVTIELPPLRERKTDIPELASFFMTKYNREFGKRLKGIQPAVLKAFSDYNWPGNIRQLESVMERAVLMSDADVIGVKDIAGELRYPQTSEAFDFEIPDEGMSLDDLEERLLRKAMTKANGVVSKAAKMLGMSYKTFWYRWEKLNPGAAPRRDLPPE